MGKSLFAGDGNAKRLFEQADATLGFSLSRICFEGPEAELKRTSITQPAIFLHSTVAARMIEGRAAMAAGHSLGEYSALVYAGSMSFEDGLRLVRLRGELMEEAGRQQRGTMAAVVGLDPKSLGEVCCKAFETGVVQAANFNSPGQTVISGTVEGVHEAMKLAKERGAKLVKELQVSGAFHSPLMESARTGLKTALDQMEIRDATIPVYANVSAKPATRASEIRELLYQQLTSPVRWEETIRAMAHDGATTFVEVGPGKVLQGLVKRTVEEAETKGIDTMDDVANNRR